jgi:hypothetical protein
MSASRDLLFCFSRINHTHIKAFLEQLAPNSPWLACCKIPNAEAFLLPDYFTNIFNHLPDKPAFNGFIPHPKVHNQEPSHVQPRE